MMRFWTCATLACASKVDGMKSSHPFRAESLVLDHDMETLSTYREQFPAAKSKDYLADFEEKTRDEHIVIGS